MNEEDFLEAVASFIDANDGAPWKDRAKSLVALARANGQDGPLNELVSWFGGDLDAIS